MSIYRKRNVVTYYVSIFQYSMFTVNSYLLYIEQQYLTLNIDKPTVNVLIFLYVCSYLNS